VKITYNIKSKNHIIIYVEIGRNRPIFYCLIKTDYALGALGALLATGFFTASVGAFGLAGPRLAGAFDFVATAGTSVETVATVSTTGATSTTKGIGVVAAGSCTL
jgi:hypothetical protein